MLFFLSILFFDSFLKQGTELEAVPEEGGFYLVGPSDLLLDPQGFTYILDSESGTVFQWDPAGHYLGHSGQEGQGPGEFQFRAGSGGPHGYLGQVNQKIFVYEATKEISIFNKNFDYQSSILLNVPQGRTNYFRVLQNEQFVISSSSYFSKEAYVAAGIFGRDGNLLRELVRQKDESWSRKEIGGKEKMVYYPYCNRLVVAYDETQDQILVGSSHRPEIIVFDSEGNKLKTIHYSGKRAQVSQEEKQAYLDQAFMKNDYFRAEFEDYKPYFSQIFPLSGDRYLLYLNIKHEDLGYCTVIDGNGKILQTFSMATGDQGRLFSSRGRIAQISAQGENDLRIRFLEPGLLPVKE